MIRLLIFIGIILLFYAVGAYWSDLPDKAEKRKPCSRHKKRATPKSDYERKCRYIFSDNAEWCYILQEIKK